ncbi:hypothetical protein BJ170DRAFT_595379 [Xylariales sp. AK1849]|nr:hypothetical protein BJ170DRAFT_595379 [Xylariales sp. AK1849]
MSPRPRLLAGLVLGASIIVAAIVIPVVLYNASTASGAHSSSAVEAQPATTSSPSGGRTLWSDGYSIETDWDTNWPETGVTRMYTSILTEVDQIIGSDGGLK